MLRIWASYPDVGKPREVSEGTDGAICDYYKGILEAVGPGLKLGKLRFQPKEPGLNSPNKYGEGQEFFSFFPPKGNYNGTWWWLAIDHERWRGPRGFHQELRLAPGGWR